MMQLSAAVTLVEIAGILLHSAVVLAGTFEKTGFVKSFVVTLTDALEEQPLAEVDVTVTFLVAQVV